MGRNFFSDFLKNPYPISLPSKTNNYGLTEILWLSCIIGTIYFIFAYCSLILSKTTIYSSVSAVWLPAGIASYVVLRFGGKALPGIFLGSILGNLYISTHNLGWVLMVSIGNTVAPWLAVEILRRIDPNWAGFRQIKSTLIYLISIAWLNGVVSGGFAAVGSVIFRGFHNLSIIWQLWWSWAISDIFAILSFGTLIIMQGFKPRTMSKKDTTIFRILIISVTIISSFLFLFKYQDNNPLQGVAGLIIIPLLWAETQFPVEKVYKFSSWLFMIAATSSAYGLGPYHGFKDIPPETFYQLVAAGLLSVLLIGGSIEEERYSATIRLKSLNETLEADIHKRTRQIKKLLNDERSITAIQDALLKNTTAGVGLVRYPERHYVMVNQAFLNIMGYAHKEDVIGKNSRILYPDDETYRKVGLVAEEVLKNGSGSAKAVPFRKADNSLIYIDFSAVKVRNERNNSGSNQIIWTLIDVTERQRLAETLSKQALVDPLTGLPNRRALDLTMNNAIARMNRFKQPLAIAIIDLDNFKPINDTYGHENGDKVLCSIASRLMDSLRKTDFIARLGGDEFVFIIENVVSIEEVIIVLNKIKTTVTSPIPLENLESVTVGLSMGLVICNHEKSPETPDKLLRYADQALYESKQHKQNRQRFWTLYGDSATTSTQSLSVASPQS